MLRSWNERYQAETGPMLEVLQQRLREMGDPTTTRRPSIFPHHNSTGSVHHHNSTGSVHSNTGSFGYPSPQSLPPGSDAYRRPSVTSQHLTSYGEPGQAHHASSPPYHHQSDPFSEQPVQPFQQMFQQPSGQQFGFGRPSSAQQQRYPPHSKAPSSQFASWGGYSGFSAGDTLDEENAVAPESSPWNFDDK